MIRELRPHQSRALALLKSSLMAGKRRPMLAMPTGAGKTLLAAAIVDGALRKGNRVIFSVPRLSLIDQTVEAFWREGIRDVGVVQARHELTNARRAVQVVSVQTLKNRDLPPADVVVIDEAHEMHKFYPEWMALDEWRKVPFIGLSATPWTRGLGKIYDDLIVAATTQSLIDEGYLSPFRVFAPAHPDLSGVRTKAGDYHEGDLGEAMDRPGLTADIVDTWKRMGEGRPTLCFAVNCAHARRIQRDFQAAGIPCGYVDAHTGLDERKAIGNAFHAGELKILCNVGVLTTGVDYDVRCIILARPTKSEALYVQMIGRGLRTADGKQDCLLRDTLVLTDRGEVKIQNLTTDHKVWDGVNFVSHGGAVCQGVRPVISHDGITATPDHKVMTDDGWMSLAEAHRRKRRIARTGFGREPLRFSDDYLSEGGRIIRQTAGRGFLLSLFGHPYGPVPQHQETARDGSMSALQRPTQGHGAAVALRAMPGAAGPLLQSSFSVLRSIWRAWNRVSVSFGARRGGLDRGEPWHCRQVDGTGSDRQRRSLRTGQSALGDAGIERREQQAVSRRSRSVHCPTTAASRGEVCRPNIDEAHSVGIDGRGNHSAMEHSFVQAEGEVWDVLNAGPLQRFTANGRLVHNCMILDHSDTTLRLGFVTDIHRDELDDGKPKAASETRQRNEPLPKECPQCTYLKPPRIVVCPCCGFKTERQSDIECEAGELVEMRRSKKPTPEQKRKFFAELRGYATERGKSEKWVLAQFRGKFNEWPHKKWVPAEPPSPETLGWIKSRQIAWAKSQQKRQAA